MTVGDYAVLVSDGLLVDGPGWVAKQLELSAAAGEAPEKVARPLVETARVRAQKTGRPDDITAAVLRLEKCVDVHTNFVDFRRRRRYTMKA